MRLTIPLFVTVMVLTACGSSGGDDPADNGFDPGGTPDTTVIDYGVDGSTPDTVEPGDTQDPDTEPADGTTGEVGEITRRIVLMAETTFQQVAAEQQYDINVVLEDIATGDPVPYESVNFKFDKV